MTPQTARDLMCADRKATDACQRFSDKHLTAYSVFWLERWGIPTLYENIAVLNARLFPHKFTMPGLPEYPDLERTNRSILQMRPKYGGFATSDRQKGVFLTEKGHAEVAKVVGALGAPAFDGKADELPPIDVGPVLQRGKRDRTYNPARDIAGPVDPDSLPRHAIGPDDLERFLDQLPEVGLFHLIVTSPHDKPWQGTRGRRTGDYILDPYVGRLCVY